MFKLYERKRIVVEAAQWFPYMAIEGVESIKRKMIDPESAQEKIVVDSAIIRDGGMKVEIQPGDYVVRTKNGLRRIPYDAFAYDYDEITEDQLAVIRAEFSKKEKIVEGE